MWENKMLLFWWDWVHTMLSTWELLRLSLSTLETDPALEWWDSALDLIYSKKINLFWLSTKECILYSKIFHIYEVSINDVPCIWWWPTHQENRISCLCPIRHHQMHGHGHRIYIYIYLISTMVSTMDWQSRNKLKLQMCLPGYHHNVLYLNSLQSDLSKWGRGCH